MSSQDSAMVDRSKLTQRELLLLLANQMDGLKDDVSELKKETPKLRDRILTLETKIYVVAGSFGAMGVILSLIIQVFKLFQ